MIVTVWAGALVVVDVLFGFVVLVDDLLPPLLPHAASTSDRDPQHEDRA